MNYFMCALISMTKRTTLVPWKCAASNFISRESDLMAEVKQTVKLS